MRLDLATLGNDLYTGKRSVPVVPQRRRFYTASAVVMLIAVFGLVTQGLNLGLEFRGGSEFRVATASLPGDYEQVARGAVGATEDQRGVNVTLVGNNVVRVQTERLSDTDSQNVRGDLAEAFGVAESEVSGTFIGPSWGASVSGQALRALVIFLVAVALVMTIYFRNWKMAAAALIALVHDMVITVGIYALSGFEVSPATMIGFLTVLGYSLYDTVVVFDKVRENTNEAFANGRLTFAQAANLAVNQTMVRSINTTVIGLLPIAAVLAVGAVFLGPGVLLDLSLVLFVGILVGAYSSIFIATPLLVSRCAARTRPSSSSTSGRPATRPARPRTRRRPRRPSAPATRPESRSPSARAAPRPPRARAPRSPGGPCTSTPSPPRPVPATSLGARRSPSADPLTPARAPHERRPGGWSPGGLAPRRRLADDYTPVMAEDTTTAAAGTPTPGVSSRARARAALALVGRNRLPENPVLEPLLQVVRSTHPKADLSIVERAYAVAERAHEGQKRRSGDDYITHPLAVTTILAELGMTPTTLAAALLHDTVEDTSYSLEALRRDFGDEIAMLVDGVTKLDKVNYGQAAQAETVRKMVVAMARDIRVLVIKLADRLHNARTWRYVSVESAQRKAKETLEIYAPLAHRLGMNTIKWELEDLSFQALYPKVYDEIVRLVAERAPAREEYLASVRDEVGSDLRSAKIKATVTGRPKHYYSVYQKMIVGGRDFEQIYDLVAVRVLVETVRDCYAALGALHARWNPVPGRFKDYIAMPKFNMYQSLHTTVIGPGGKPVEIQIRTHTMHRRAEYGVAAHWKYKEDPSAKGVGAQGGVQARDGQSGPINDMAWLRQLLDWQKETSDPGEFLESLRFEITASEVYVFTPKGQLVGLPAGSTPVDFAYAVHTEVGHHCIGARVNGRLVPLESRLDNGDVVEVLTSKADSAGPSRDWLSFVRSARARNKIRHWFTKERREEMIDEGKNSLAKVMRKQGLPLQRLTSVESLTGVAEELRLPGIDALYAAIGEGHVSAQHVVSRLVASVGGEDGASEDIAEAAMPATTARPSSRRSGDPGVVVKGMADVWVKPRGAARPCRRRHPGLRDARQRRLGAPPRLHERRLAALPAREDHRGRVGADLREHVPRAAPGRGARPVAAALGRHEGHLRPRRQHPLGSRHHLARPGGQAALHLRDG